MSPEVEARGRQVGMAMLGEMHRLCAARGVPFFVVLLPQPIFDGRQGQEIADDLRRGGIPYLTLGRLGGEGDYYLDSHPMPQVHRAIARRVAQAPALKRALGRP